MLAFLTGLGFGLTIGTIAAAELRALALRIYRTVRLWLTHPDDL